MKEKFMKNVETIWDKVKDLWENTKVWALISGIVLAIGGIGFTIGCLTKKR